MESKLDNFKENHEGLESKHTLAGASDGTQLGSGDEYNVLLNQSQFCQTESQQNERKEPLEYESEKNITNIVDNSVFGSAKIILKEEKGCSLRSDGEKYLYLLNNFRRSESTPETYNAEAIELGTMKGEGNALKDPLAMSPPKTHKTKNQSKLNNNDKYLLQKSVISIKRGNKGSKVNDTARRNFGSICDALNSEQDMEKYANENTGLTNPGKKEAKIRKINAEEEERKKNGEPKKRRVGRPSKYIEIDSDSSSTILSTSSSDESSLRDSEYKEEVEEKKTKERRGRKKKLEYKPSEVMEKYMTTMNECNGRTIISRIKSKVEKQKTRKEQEKRDKINRELTKRKEEKNIPESINEIEGVKYDAGLEDLRRKHKSFDQLCFGLGCIVGPTKQELQMCTELFNLGDDLNLSRYETSVYQSCLLRTRAFENLWRKFCNRVIEIIRTAILDGINNLIKVIELQQLVHPFLKVVMLDMSTDRQDQELFLNIMQEEMDGTINPNYMVVRVNTTTNNVVDEAIKQMYIEMNKLILISRTKKAKEEGREEEEEESSRRTTKIRKYEEGNEDNLLERLIKLYNRKFKEKELIIILHKLNNNVNEILYLFQMLKRKRLIEIKSLVVICSNNEYLEKYCDARIYSNLGIFQCNMLTLSNLADEIAQMTMYDEKVQDFIPNYQMLLEIYEQFYNQDYSLTLFIIRIYQMFEEYYKKNIFSYLSIVPPELVDWGQDEEEETEKNDMPSKPPGYNPNKGINQEFWEKKDNQEVMLPLESLIKEKEKEVRDPTKMSDVSTTTSTVSSSVDNNNNGSSLSTQEGPSNLTAESKEGEEYEANGKETGTKSKYYGEGEGAKELNRERLDKRMGLEVKEMRGKRRKEKEKERKEIVKREILEKERGQRVEQAKNLYSIYSLLCISNNMTENHIAYLELKLGSEMELEKIVLEYLPLNTLVMLQRRILFQLGVNLLYKLLAFLPDSYTLNKRMNHMVNALPPFSRLSKEGSKEDRDKPTNELLKKLFKSLNMKCTIANTRHENVKNLVKMVKEFNKEYRTGIQLVINIEMFLEGEGKKTKEETQIIRNMNSYIDESSEVDELLEQLKSKLHMCLFPSITNYKVSKILGVQSYTNMFKPDINMSPASEGSKNYSQGDISFSVGNGSVHQGSKLKKSSMSLKQERQEEEDIIMYIYKHIKYKIINMWKLFIIYYYILTSNKEPNTKENHIVEVYIKFNINIEMLEKIYKIVLISQNNSIIMSRQTPNPLEQKNVDLEDESQLCYLIKSSMSNVNVKFM